MRGGTLRVLSADNIDRLDTAVTYTPNGIAVARTYARTLYGYNLAGPPEWATVPVLDIASRPPRLSADQRTYTFTMRPGVRYAPRSTARSPRRTSSPPSGGSTTSRPLHPASSTRNSSPGPAGSAPARPAAIAGLVAPNPRTLKITLAQPAGDFLSILTMPFFAPVPGEYAAGYQVGANYDGHVVGSGPYTLDAYIPGRLVVLVRNPNWHPATDPLRKAWVDRIQVKLSVPFASIQRAIEREEADLSLDSHVPQTRLAALQADPERSRRVSVNSTGSLLFLALGTHRAPGAIADVRVRQAHPLRSGGAVRFLGVHPARYL